MATDSKTTSGLPPDTADISDQIISNLAAADNLAAQRVQTLAWVHQARAAQLSRTAASLKAQSGPADPDVKSAESAAAAANATAAQADMVHQQITTANPHVPPGGWVLHGRVRDAQLKPASRYTVFLVNSAKTFQPAYGFAYTDNTGYFLLNYPAGGTASGNTLPKGVPKIATPPDLFIEVADTKARPVFLSASAFQPLIDSATYQNIVLPAGQQPIGDPPAEIRGVAIPNATEEKKS